MKTELEKLLNEIRKNINIDIDIYTQQGDFITSTNGMPHFKYKSIQLDSFTDSVFTDKENSLIYFLVEVPYNNFIGVIMGADEIEKNYAYLVCRILKENLLHFDGVNFRLDGFKRILLGQASREQIQTYMHKYSLPNKQLFVIAMDVALVRKQEIIVFLNHYTEDSNDIVVSIDDKLMVYIRFSGSDKDYQSPLEFVTVLNENLYEETGERIYMGIGSPVANLFDITSSYSQAANALRMGILANDKQYIHSYKEYIMLKMIEDIPKPLLQNYLDVLLDENAVDIIKDVEMLNTAEEFLNNSLNISETSRHLYMHRNTLTYRLDKIEKAMGLNIRNFGDAVTFRIIIMLYKLLKKN